MLQSMIRQPAAAKALGRPTTSFYEDIKKGLITKPVKLSERSVAWPQLEIQALQQARIAGKTPDEIRQLVSKLMADRANEGGAK